MTDPSAAVSSGAFACELRIGPPRHDGDSTRSHQLDDAIRPHQIDERFDLPLRAGDLHDQLLGRDVDDPAAEYVGQFPDLGAAVAGRGVDLDEHQVAFDEILRTDVEHPHDGDDLFQLPPDLLQHPVVADDDKRHSRQLGIFGLADGQAIDIEAAGRQHARDVGQHARNVLHDRR